MKKGVIKFFPVLLILLTSFVSAASFSIDNIFGAFDMETIFYLTAFILLFALFSIATKRAFKNSFKGNENRAIPTIIALALTFFAIYGFYKSEFGIPDFFRDIQLFEGIIGILLPILILIILIILLKRLKSYFLLALGTICILLSVLKIVYEREIIFWTGIALVIAWIIYKLAFRKREHIKFGTGGVDPDPTDPGQDINWQREANRQRKEARKQENRAIKNAQRANEEKERAKQAELMIQRQKKIRRNLSDLKQKYVAYISRYNPQLPSHQKHQIKKALKIIIAYAGRHGVKKKVFLSKKIGGIEVPDPKKLN